MIYLAAAFTGLRRGELLAVREARLDLLEIEPVDLGPGSPVTAALQLARGPALEDPNERGE
jgi:hypothetical protein